MRRHFSITTYVAVALLLLCVTGGSIVPRYVSALPIMMPVQGDDPIVGGGGRYSCTDTINCQLTSQINATDYFLKKHKVGLYSPDPRPLTPVTEVARLNIVPQALAYLNLYQTTGRTDYRHEATDRLYYLLSVGPENSYGDGVRAGMSGYAFLLAYELMGIEQFRVEGMRIANDCLQQDYHDMGMNGGLMCGMNLAKAYKLTGDTRYRDAERLVIEHTATYESLNGAFPHQAGFNCDNTSYSSWMFIEMLIIRKDDPGFEMNDLLLAKGVNFLLQRVNPDGSISYSDANGSYYCDPDNLDARYWTNELAAFVVVLNAGNQRAAANKVLSFLMSKESTGVNYGGFPDKYDGIDQSLIWTAGNPSVLRTSLNFWYLSSIATLGGSSCASGPTVSCTITPTSCSSLYESTGLCVADLGGVKSCLSGTYTSCFDIATTHIGVGLFCYEENYCEDDPLYGACYYHCSRSGVKICVGGVCEGICYGVPPNQQCESDCYKNQWCIFGGNEPAGEAPITSVGRAQMCVSDT